MRDLLGCRARSLLERRQDSCLLIGRASQEREQGGTISRVPRWSSRLHLAERQSDSKVGGCVRGK